MKRTRLYNVGVIVHALNSLFIVLLTFPGLLQGPSGQAPTEGVPQVVVLLAMPGVLLAPTPFTRISTIASVLVALFVIFALLHRPKPTAA